MRWQPILYEIRALKLALARLDPRAGMPVMPPGGASPRAIEAVERRFGRPLPPSYRALLAAHDGVPQLYHGASLLGARPLAQGTYVNLARLVIDAPGPQGGADLVPFGIDARGETIFAWDRAEERPDGELEVVVWINDIGERVDGFPAFLSLVREMLAAEIEDRQRTSWASSRRRIRGAPQGLELAFA
jgi:hypothetical protein